MSLMYVLKMCEKLKAHLASSRNSGIQITSEEKGILELILEHSRQLYLFQCPCYHSLFASGIDLENMDTLLISN